MLRGRPARIFLEAFLLLVTPCERLIGGPDMLARGALLLDGRLGRVVLGPFGGGFVRVRPGRVLV